jgi:hypothetical protein
LLVARVDRFRYASNTRRYEKLPIKIINPFADSVSSFPLLNGEIDAPTVTRLASAEELRLSKHNAQAVVKDDGAHFDLRAWSQHPNPQISVASRATEIGYERVNVAQTVVGPLC